MGFHVMTINSSLNASCGIQSMHAILCDNKQKSTIISIKRSLIVSSTEIIISHDITTIINTCWWWSSLVVDENLDSLMTINTCWIWFEFLGITSTNQNPIFSRNTSIKWGSQSGLFFQESAKKGFYPLWLSFSSQNLSLC